MTPVSLTERVKRTGLQQEGYDVMMLANMKKSSPMNFLLLISVTAPW